MYVNVFSLNDFVLWHKLSLSGFYVNINQQDMRKPPNFSSAEVNQSFTGSSFAPAFLTLSLQGFIIWLRTFSVFTMMELKN